jgi:Protein of unknown function (DUF3617)
VCYKETRERAAQHDGVLFEDGYYVNEVNQAKIEEESMRKMILLGAMLASATILLADSSVQPLNVKPGLWEVTMNMTISGSKAPQTRTYRSCLKKEDLNKYPFVDPDKKCTYTVSSSTGSTMEASGTCAPGSEGARIDFKLRLDALDTENVKGTGQMTMSMNGSSMNGNYAATAKWIGSSCPAAVR